MSEVLHCLLFYLYFIRGQICDGPIYPKIFLMTLIQMCAKLHTSPRFVTPSTCIINITPDSRLSHAPSWSRSRFFYFDHVLPSANCAQTSMENVLEKEDDGTYHEKADSKTQSCHLPTVQ